MTVPSLAAVLPIVGLLALSPALAQSDAKLAPGSIADGAKAGVNSADGLAPDGKPSPGGRQGEGQQAATSGSKMVKQGDSGAGAPARSETPNKP